MKQPWEIVYYSEKIEKQILDLPWHLQSHYLRLTDLMQKFGPHLRPPHTKSIGGGLFELRLKSHEGIGRIFYCTVIGCRIVMLHGFVKKSQKTPSNELDIAKRRMKEIKEKFAQGGK